MHASSILFQLLSAAAAVSALPQPVNPVTSMDALSKREIVDVKAACADWRPASDELMILTTFGHFVTYNQQGHFDSEYKGQTAVLLNQACEVVSSNSYEAQGVGKGFLAQFGFYYNGVGPEPSRQITIKSNPRSIGAWAIAKPSITVNGEGKEAICDGEKSSAGGLNVGYWRACNFKPGNVWPWWPKA
ncbi:hypothetical protein ColTof4_04456 [Colletotrichum tofieldiae]|uniref:Uncharacterized protein n=1 Tax=Colletotrichum tofieldiae TaxID=708197 RepID=A0A166P4N8_9PEZI|nr:hypothetical protein CT0861_08803 [Colletotrichum tofieldiae]GKT63997.1 hypothetical protein ColTof3_11336 [Colletotrichum tofieldiae]GKT72033.1 hypothetical protein ColTof4_04456 [Colletotrichum tofieldiae]GKT90188.1 hypothetical protein Ct61P_08038 [Colletotrichum tofieldiae]